MYAVKNNPPELPTATVPAPPPGAYPGPYPAPYPGPYPGPVGSFLPVVVESYP